MFRLKKLSPTFKNDLMLKLLHMKNIFDLTNSLVGERAKHSSG